MPQTTSPTPKAALAAYSRACQTHKRADWRMACHLLAAVVSAVEAEVAEATPVRVVSKPRRDKTLCEFLSGYGINDLGGELRARDADLWHREKPFRRRLLRDDGVSLDHAASLAWEHGYFPHVPIPSMDGGDNMHAVTADMLIAAIDRELAGVRSEPEDDPAYWAALDREAA